MTGSNNKNKGFTIVEMLVSSVVFSIIFGAAISILIYSIRMQKYNLVHNQLLNQTSYATEYMARALRMSVKDDGSCGSANNYQVFGTRVRFMNYKGDCQEFYTENGQLKVKIEDGGSLSGGVVLTSDDFEIVNLNFSKRGDGADTLQPKVTFFIDVRAKNLPDKPRIRIQSTVSQRNIDK